MKLAILALFLQACAAPAARPAAPPAAPQTVACGRLTCAADEYCEIRCTCCGMRIPDPSEASAAYACKKLPAFCAGGGDPPDRCRRLVEIPCA